MQVTEDLRGGNENLGVDPGPGPDLERYELTGLSAGVQHIKGDNQIFEFFFTFSYQLKHPLQLLLIVFCSKLVNSGCLKKDSPFIGGLIS